MVSHDRVQVIKPPNTLRSKVKVGGPGAVNSEALERAENIIASLGDEYLTWARDDLKKLDEAFAKVKETPANKEEIGAVYKIVHEIKGSGGSFGYDMITVVSDQLCKFIEKLESVGARESAVIQLHLDALKIVIAKGMKGDGGEAGRQLLQGLRGVIAKFA